MTVDRYASNHRMGVSDVLSLVNEGLVVSREERDRVYVFDPFGASPTEMQGPVEPDAASRKSAPRDSTAMVPMSYAEKAMNSIMHLHGEMMEEKEKRIEQEKLIAACRQEVEDMRMLVRLLEKELDKCKTAEQASSRPRAAGQQQGTEDGWVG